MLERELEELSLGADTEVSSTVSREERKESGAA